jgi:hypothetical protein
MYMSTSLEQDDLLNEIYYSINLVETIKKALKKKNVEYIELAKSNTLTEEGKKGWKF